MQLLNRTSSLGTNYTKDQVVAQLFGPAISEQWVFDWLGPDGRYLGDFTKYLDDALTPKVIHDVRQSMKRSLIFNVRSIAALSGVNPLQDLVRVHYQLKMPDGGWVDFTVGTFALLPPKKEIKVKTNQTFQCADLSQLLIDGAFTSTFTMRAGNAVGPAATAIVSSLRSQYPFQFILPDATGKVLASDLVWEAGTSRLQALNDVMAAFNYAPVFIDEIGQIRSYPLPDWSQAANSYTFDLMNTSAGKIPVSEQKDLSKAFNQCLVVVERGSPTPATFAVLAQNTNPASEVSINRWHAKMGPVIRDPKIVDLVTAVARARYEVQAAARVYDPIIVQTLSWPVSQDLDVYGLFYNTADEGVQYGKFLELRWEMECVPGGTTTHELQRVFGIE